MSAAWMRHLIGVSLLLCVVVIWVGGSELMQYVFIEENFAKPFFLTYCSTSTLSVYLLISLLKTLIIKCRNSFILNKKKKKLRQNAHDEEDDEESKGLVHDLDHEAEDEDDEDYSEHYVGNGNGNGTETQIAVEDEEGDKDEIETHARARGGHKHRGTTNNNKDTGARGVDSDSDIDIDLSSPAGVMTRESFSDDMPLTEMNGSDDAQQNRKAKKSGKGSAPRAQAANAVVKLPLRQVSTCPFGFNIIKGRKDDFGHKSFFLFLLPLLGNLCSLSLSLSLSHTLPLYVPGGFLESPVLLPLVPGELQHQCRVGVHKRVEQHDPKLHLWLLHPPHWHPRWCRNNHFQQVHGSGSEVWLISPVLVFLFWVFWGGSTNYSTNWHCFAAWQEWLS